MLRSAFLVVVLFSIDGMVRAAEVAGARPNIIFILTDDLGYGDAGCTGNPIVKTPNIDRLHQESFRFRDFHVSPTCSPTRAAIMTGRHEFHSGVTHTINERERMSLGATTIAQVLQSAGYKTGIFGKWHLGDEAAYQPGRRGFDEVYIHGGGGIGQGYPGTCGDAPGNIYFDPVILHNGKFEKTNGFCTDVFFKQATQWIQHVKGKQPFFCYLPTNAAHAPLSCPPQYEVPYKGRVAPLVSTFYGMIANIDENVGTLMNQLKEMGIDDNTLVIFMNDNGGFDLSCKIWNAGMKGSKNTAHNGGTRAMSFWRWPAALTPATCDALTAQIDMFPTFADLAGAQVPTSIAGKVEGFSLVPLLKDPSAAWHDERILYTHVGRWANGAPPDKYGQCSARWGPYLLFRQSGQSKWELYDLKADPGEEKNLAPSRGDIVTKLDTAYDAWWTQTLPLLENEGAYKTAPQINPFKAMYWRQYKGAGPNNVPAPAGFDVNALP